MKRLFSKFLFALLIFALSPSSDICQTDTVKYQWPVAPLNSSQGINGTFCEFRNTLSSDHFHNGVDIGEPDGNPVYPCIDGSVSSIVISGSNSYVGVQTNVNGLWKRITYLHIVPNPALSVGQNVTTGVTVLGTIYSGMGHTHLIERELVSSPSDYAVGINNLRENGGLEPYIDTYPPIIHASTLEFRINNTGFTIPSYGLSDKIDIIIKIEEQNGTTTSHRNNGTYMLGYRIWTPDTLSMVYAPDDNGLKYKFDRKPLNNDVDKVFVRGVATLSNPVYYLTNGEGASYVNAALGVGDNYFDTELVPEGDYLLEVFSEDTRYNFSNIFFPITITRDDIIPPGRPTLTSILNTNGKKSLFVSWQNNTEPDIQGYRLYYTGNTSLVDWHLAADETILTKDTVAHSFSSPAEFLVPPAGDVYFFYLTAVDSNGNESERSNIYSRSSYENGSSFIKALIVDGFDRYGGSGSWQEPIHTFNLSYFIPLTFVDSVVISSCSNEAVIDNIVDLLQYHMVIWFLGDESTAENTFITVEQGKLANYLEMGGKLFVTGSEVGWDLDRSHSNSQPSDTLFYRHYLKAKLVNDGNSNMNQAAGVAGTIFEDLTLTFGEVYNEDYPDDIEPINGSEAILNYNITREDMITQRKAGAAYTGNFGSSTNTGQVIYISFPFETISSLNKRIALITDVMEYFGLITGLDEPGTENIPSQFSLSPNYPNPFNPSTKFKITIPQNEHVSIKIYDVLGREAATLIDDTKKPGIYAVEWDAANFSSGVYYARFKAGNFVQTRSLLLLK